MQEISKYTTAEETTALFVILKPKITKVEVSIADVEKAKTMRSHYPDSLHAVLAKKINADYIVTRNIKDFPLFEAVTPEYILKR